MLVAVRRCVLVVVLVGLILWPTYGAQRASASSELAQSASRLATLSIDVWPEYDQPATVLVIYRGEFALDALFPTQVKIRIPASAGAPSAVASPPPGSEAAPVNQWTDLIATRRVTTASSGDWIEVAFAPLSYLFTLEFYDKLNTVTFDRQYQLTWPGDLAADSVKVNVREPFGATNFQAAPDLPPGTRDDDGLVAHQLTQAGLAAGQPFVLSLSYHREDRRTSVEALQLITPTPIRSSVPAPAAGKSLSWLLVAALVLGLALVLGGVVWYIRSQQAETFRPYQPPQFRRGAGRRSVRTSRALRSRTQTRPVITLPPTAQDSAGFCTQCGKPLRPDDVYCSRCGARVKGK